MGFVAEVIFSSLNSIDSLLQNFISLFTLTHTVAPVTATAITKRNTDNREILINKKSFAHI